MRLSSGTIGFSSTALAASTAGTGGMEVRPAPSRAPRSRVDDVPTRRVTLLPPAPAADPRAVEASWLDARDTVDGDWARPAGIVATDSCRRHRSTRSTAGEPAGPGEPQTSQ